MGITGIGYGLCTEGGQGNFLYSQKSSVQGGNRGIEEADKAWKMQLSKNYNGRGEEVWEKQENKKQ